MCGTPAAVGLIFCKECGGRFARPFRWSRLFRQTPLLRTFSLPRWLLFSSLGCAAIDFVWGYFRERSVPAGVISAVGGLFGTAWYLLLGRWMSQLLKRGSQDNDRTSSF